MKPFKNLPIRRYTARISPIQKVLISFLMLILAGALFLMLPMSTVNGISFVDALFTSTSAVCVTGLVVLDTARDFTMFGQAAILLLIQFGGLGIMTFTIAIISMAGGDFSIQWRFTFESLYNELGKLSIRGILKRILLYTVTIELAFAALLFTQFAGTYDPGEAAWHSLFHSISAFCNAGFSTFSDNLAGYRDNPVVITAVGFDIILGGLGFVVLTELLRMRLGGVNRFRFWGQFSLHTRTVLATTALLVVGGMLLFMALEWDYILGDMPLSTGLLTGFFQSVTCRTAGFNTVDIGRLRDSTLFVMTALMFIGGSPGSIAGGIKTTTAAVVTWLLYTKLIGRRQVTFWGLAVPDDTVDRGVTLTFIALLLISAGTFFLLAISGLDRKVRFLEALFEVTSAFNTVGLSTGITQRIPTTGKLLLVLVMYVGRLGPLTIIAALTSRKKDVALSYAEENIMIG